MPDRRAIRIGLTNFLRFMSATGLTRVNAVDEALQEYRDWKDYYRDLREQMILALKDHDPERLRRFMRDRALDARTPHFSVCAAGLIEWMAVTDYRFIRVQKGGRWSEGELQISVNPEVAIAVDGVEYLVKLYLAKGSLSKPARAAFAWLVRETHGSAMTPALLEVRKHRLFPTPSPSSRIGRWVRGEAQAFINYTNIDAA